MSDLVPPHFPTSELHTLASLRQPDLLVSFTEGPAPILRHEALGEARLKVKLNPAESTIQVRMEAAEADPVELKSGATLKHLYLRDGFKEVSFEAIAEAPAEVAELTLLTNFLRGICDLRSLPNLRVFSASRCGLVSVKLAGLTALTTVYLSSNQLFEVEVGQLLIDLDANGASDGSFTYDGNPGAHDRLRSKVATQAYKNLLARGWRINGYRRA